MKINAKILFILALAFIFGFVLFYSLTLFLLSDTANAYFAAFFRDM